MGALNQNPSNGLSKTKGPPSPNAGRPKRASIFGPPLVPPEANPSKALHPQAGSAAPPPIPPMKNSFTHTYTYDFSGPYKSNPKTRHLCHWKDGKWYEWNDNTTWTECVEHEGYKKDLPPGWTSDINLGDTYYCYWRTETPTWHKPGPLVPRRRRRLTNQDLIDRFIRES